MSPLARVLVVIALSIAGTAQGQQQPTPEARLLSRFEWRSDDPRLQSFSAIDTHDGVNATVLTGWGVVVTGRLIRVADGQITGFEPRGIHYLRDPEGQPLSGPWRYAEGLAIAADGRLFVSFEGHDRVWSYAAPDARADPLPQHIDFERLSVGAGLSALAINRDGTLYTIPERAARMTHGFPSYHFWNGEWGGSFRLPSDGHFLPVGADIGPDGKLYVLEREHSSSSGYRSQVRRFVLEGSRIDTGTVVMRSDFGQFDNLEGVSVWRDRAGRLRLLMISDNGDNAGLRSEIVEFILPH